MIKRSFIGILIGLLIFSGCSNNKLEEKDSLKFKEEYEALNDKENDNNGKKYRSLEIDEDNPFVYKNADDIIEMMDDGETFVVYFGFASCPWCRSIIKSMIEACDELGITSIYYVDVLDIRDTMVVNDDGVSVTKKTGTDGYYQLLEKMNSVLDDYVLSDKDGNEVSTGEKRIYAPSIVSVVDGEAVKATDGISESQTDGYMELTDEMIEESIQKIKCSISCVADRNKVCSSNKKC